jgi:hypothetical protein
LFLGQAGAGWGHRPHKKGVCKHVFYYSTWKQPPKMRQQLTTSHNSVEQDGDSPQQQLAYTEGARSKF